LQRAPSSGGGGDGLLAADLLGAKGLGLLRWSSRRMLCMPDEEERGGITMGIRADLDRGKGRGGCGEGEGESAELWPVGWMDRIERSRGG